MKTPHTILLKGHPQPREGIAGESGIKPGMLIARTAAGELIKHNSSTAVLGPVMIAREMEFAGANTSIDDTYDAGDVVLFYIAQPGDEYYALIDTGEDVAIGAMLESAANGALQAVTSTHPVRAVALEAVDNNPGVAGTRIRVEVVA